jgi:hypothetical protein
LFELLKIQNRNLPIQVLIILSGPVLTKEWISTSNQRHPGAQKAEGQIISLCLLNL